MVICIGREFGSGGHDVGFKLAEMLGIPYYDKKILDDMEDLGMNRKDIEKADESKAGSLFQTPYFGIKDERLKGLNVNDVLFQMQSEWIYDMAQKGHCVIIGRSANYVLDKTGVPYISVFVSAPFEYRVAKEMSDHNLSEKEAATTVTKADKQRKAYYDYYTEGAWGAPSSYDICINTATYGIDKSAEILYKMIKDELDNPESIYQKRSETL